MVDEILKKLIEFLQQASPLVWASLVRQVYAIAFSQIAWSVAVLVLCFAAWKFSNFCEKQQENDDYNDDDWSTAKWVLRSLSALALLIPFGLVVSAIMRIYNPDYYAIWLILAQIK
jgi:hypothetical protein